MQQERQIAAAGQAQGGTAGEGDVRLWRGLSGKLLVLTVVFVMIAEVLIFVPSIANFRNVWLQSHLDTAEAASIVFLDTADPMLSEMAQRQLLRATGSLAVVIREGPTSRMMASDNMPGPVDATIDLTRMDPVGAIASALSMIVSPKMRTYRVFGKMKSREGEIELVQTDVNIRAALLIYSRNVLLLSLAISLITATLVFLALYVMIVRPIRRISGNMTAFSREPDNSALILAPSRRADEIGVAERRLAAFEQDLGQTLRQRQHLADLGLAVSKINHDLRNILASAQLFTDRISRLPDPTVQRIAPKLIRAINRAIDYTHSVLAYGRAVEAPPERRRLALSALVEDVHDLLGEEAETHLVWVNEVPVEMEIEADPEQLLRVLLNLARNSAQAFARRPAGEDGAPGEANRITVSARRLGAKVQMRVADNGPGMSEAAREGLFRAFGGSTRPGGTGLGLAIAAELVRAHGGSIALDSTSPQGTVFLIELPQPAN